METGDGGVVPTGRAISRLTRADGLVNAAVARALTVSCPGRVRYPSTDRGPRHKCETQPCKGVGPTTPPLVRARCSVVTAQPNLILL
jgi:hypothetical protein